MEENKLYKIYLQEYEKGRRNLDIFTNLSKKKIITAAIDLFAQNGYSNVSMRDLANAVGVKASSLYNHFPSKYDILLAIFDAQSKMQFFFINWDFGDEFSAREIISCILEYTILFTPEELELFRKMIRIMVMEQYREPLAYNAFTHYMLVESSIKYKKVFDKLISQEKMKPFDTACFSHALSCILYASVVEASHYHDYAVPSENIVPGLVEMKQYLFNLIVENLP